jgi:hypothetical protein
MVIILLSGTECGPRIRIAGASVSVETGEGGGSGEYLPVCLPYEENSSPNCTLNSDRNSGWPVNQSHRIFATCKDGKLSNRIFPSCKDVN